MRESATAAGRYGAVSMALHWAIALLIFAQIGLGWYFNEVLPDHSPIQEQYQDVHVSLGLTTLLLVVGRIGWRIHKPALAKASGLAPWELQLAKAVHLLLYALMLVLPLSGWLFLTVRHEPIPFWGVHAPALPGLEAVSGPAHRPFIRSVKHLHVFTLIWAVWIVVAVHVAGAIKHQFDGHPVLWRMIPFLKARPQP